MMKETFGQRLQRLRKWRGMSHHALAVKANLNPRYVKRLEEDDSVSPEVIERLAHALDITPEYLKTGEGPSQRDTLRNFESYVSEKGIEPHEAAALKEMVVKKLNLRAGAPLVAVDFDALRERYSAQESVVGLCWRCRHAVPSHTGDRCPNCGSLWDSPDN